MTRVVVDLFLANTCHPVWYIKVLLPDIITSLERYSVANKNKGSCRLTNPGEGGYRSLLASAFVLHSRQTWEVSPRLEKKTNISQ